MSTKPPTGKTRWSAVDYCIHRRLLRFTPRGEGTALVFHGVPPELFYGMPTGINLDNFIDIKIRGRYECSEIPTPPAVSYSTINKEYRVEYPDQTHTFRRLDGDPAIDCDRDKFSVWGDFQTTYGNRTPDRIKDNTHLSDVQ